MQDILKVFRHMCVLYDRRSGILQKMQMAQRMNHFIDNASASLSLVYLLFFYKIAGRVTVDSYYNHVIMQWIGRPNDNI